MVVVAVVGRGGRARIHFVFGEHRRDGRGRPGRRAPPGRMGIRDGPQVRRACHQEKAGREGR
jgi:hypothetical protein